MIEKLKKEVLDANLFLPRNNLVKFTWGNVSGIDRDLGVVVIKPSGVNYENLVIGSLVVVDMNGSVIEGKLKPSSDLETHLELYMNFPNVGGIVHTHSTWATIWSQSGFSIPTFGTTHADHFCGDIPCTRMLTDNEINSEYERNTARVIVETFRGINEDYLQGVLVNNHGPFTWGTKPADAVNNALVLEELAQMAYYTSMLNSKNIVKQSLLNKHFYRKNGVDAYYGQSRDNSTN